MKNKTTVGILCTILSALLFGFTPVLVQQVTATGVTTVTVILYRNFFTIFITLIWAYFSKQSLAITKNQLFKMFWIGVFGACAATLTLYSSYPFMGVGTATVIHFLYPAFAALLAWAWCKTRVTKQRWIALGLSCAGLAFFMQGDVSVIGITLAVVSAVTYAFYMVGMEKLRIALLPTCVVAFYFAVLSTGAMFAYGAVTNQLTLAMPLPMLLLCVVIAACTSFGGVVLLQIGIRNLDAGTAALLCLFEPISSMIFGMIFLHESMSITQWLGSAVIFGALLVGMKKEKAPATSTNA